jgi:hypothetical protein
MKYEYKLRVTNYKLLQVMSYEFWVLSFELLVTSYGFLVMGYELRVTNYELRGMCYELRVTSYELRDTSYELRVANYEYDLSGSADQFVWEFPPPQPPPQW